MANRGNWNERPGARQDWMNNRMENRPERAQDLQDRMSDRRDNWQDYRDDHQGDWQDRWDDWSENRWDNFYDMRHDYWNNRFDAWWDHMWDEHPVGMAFGLTTWGVNRLSYWFGYGAYGNPYASGPVDMGGGYSCDYSQPLETYEQVSAPVEAPAEAQAVAEAAPESSSPLQTAFAAARQSFYDGNYDQALTQVNLAISLANNDALLHEFRSLVLFAQGKYRDAAATIHSVLAVGPGWDWTTLSGMYPTVDVYTAQLRALEDSVKAHPDAADGHFLLAYHYITCGSMDEAMHQLREVIRLVPEDTVAVQVLQMIGGPEAVKGAPDTSSAPPEATIAAAAKPAINKDELVGVWKASGPGDAKFQLELTASEAFTWTYSQGEESTTVSGVYAIEENTLALQPDAGGVMVAEVSPPKAGEFHFQVVGGPPGDQGLDFRK
ncbi:MAG: hypothetical protein KF774_11730 [Planctomyces sp.]|nr:hypothetical protein [Planctomyces sp.]